MLDSITAKRPRPYLLLSGGRMTKWKGRVASLSPHIGSLSQSVSAIALAGFTAFCGGSLLAPSISFAGSCDPLAGAYICRFAADSINDVTQSRSSSTLSVSTDSGFGLSVTGGNALQLSAYTGLSFTDTNASAISSTGTAIHAQNFTVDYYTYAVTGSGALTISTNGTLTGNKGIEATSAGSDLTISADTVTGSTAGILAYNSGSGAVSVTATGAVTGTSDRGISATNTGTSLTIVAAAASGDTYGIRARNNGTGALSITASGAVGSQYFGIEAQNTGTDLGTYIYPWFERITRQVAHRTHDGSTHRVG